LTIDGMFSQRLSTLMNNLPGFVYRCRAADPHPAGGLGLRQRMDALERGMILEALEATRWHRGRAADLLQLNYKTLQRKMKAHGIK
jgi:DNA-binding NtrC family response regulator